MQLPIDAKIQLISELVDDYRSFRDTGEVPVEKTYHIVSSLDGGEVSREARLAAFGEFCASPIAKIAFDTRRIDQESSRNPRTNLQYWHRSDQFIDKNDERNLKSFAKLARVLGEIKKKLGTSPEWFESYARQLYDNVFRILRVKESDLDIFRPQMSYLEQLLFARYRLTTEDLRKYSEEKISQRILSKDEDLIGRSAYLKETGDSEEEGDRKKISDGGGNYIAKTTQDSIINAIFGAEGLRRDGERTVERTITIKIKDNMID